MVAQIYQGYKFAYSKLFGSHSIRDACFFSFCLQIIFKCNCIDSVLKITKL